ncbi:ubiquinol-cytochrome C chaperone family protein [Polymorphum gilvum]|uniref:Ubiquinol-cytochrome C chaperone superfamily n=1 Tax=Polymorphum gilvum (strain LMG 25793 / CGMCC 1.9160 / SL003B-26A1) TaxID=991905 RepID=F2IWM7_POLGS|nr:ubiquinol-cytochrome C chaperone family protein [Polymorphum gilvum]ADZ70352.1 Ubiquinol-cytochrome C chaperone superfamily [Polymorphum gilvum SL003B-26A1]
MVFSLFRRRRPTSEYALYGAIVAQARQPGFYSPIGVPDTVDGRFDMIVLHAILVFRRLQGEGREVAEFAQKVFDLFFRDMDGSLREMGVSDVGVPRKVKKMAEAFYGRAAAYGTALDDGELGALAAAIDRNVFPEASSPAAARALAAYAMAVAQVLAQQPVEALRRGEVAWPDPIPHHPEQETHD